MTAAASALTKPLGKAAARSAQSLVKHDPAAVAAIKESLGAVSTGLRSAPGALGRALTDATPVVRADWFAKSSESLGYTRQFLVRAEAALENAGRGQRSLAPRIHAVLEDLDQVLPSIRRDGDIIRAVRAGGESVQGEPYLDRIVRMSLGRYSIDADAGAGLARLQTRFAQEAKAIDEVLALFS